MGLLAGSTVMLLTLAWGTCIIVGKCDIENSVAIDNRDTKGFSLTGLSLSFICDSHISEYTCHVFFVHLLQVRSVFRFGSFGLVSSFIRFRGCLALCVCVLVCVFLFY